MGERVLNRGPYRTLIEETVRRGLTLKFASSEAISYVFMLIFRSMTLTERYYAQFNIIAQKSNLI
jgi:hypothetical protein